MPGLTGGALASARRAFNRVLVHTYTRTPSAGGSEDGWGETDPVPGSGTTGVPCLWGVRSLAVRDAGGTTVVSVPTLMVAATDPLKVGDQVSSVLGSDGMPIPGASGVFRVERLLDDTAGLGAALLPVWELRGAQVQN